MIAPRNDSANHSSDPESTGSQASGRVHGFVWAFGVFMVLLAGGGFLFKLIEFFVAFTSEGPMQFAIMPVITYLLVASGFGCLFIWAYLAGHFKNVEAPKYRMLEMQDEIDRSREP